ncbi:MAG: DUF4388 domain-containing protein [Microthrixaceae bacterium]
MALQGTIDILPLTDVLQLLASSARTGRLVLEGDRGRAMVVMSDGLVAGGDLDGSPYGPLDLVVGALRFREGSFVFDVDEVVLPDTAEPRPVAELLEQAAAVLAEWEEVLAVVPSAQHRVAPVATVEDEIVLAPDDWTTVLASTGVPSLEELGAQLGLGELDAGRRVVGLVGRGLLEVHEPLPPASPPEPAPVARGEDRDTAALPVPREEVPSVLGPAEVLEPPVDMPFPDHFPIDDLVEEEVGPADPWPGSTPGDGSEADAAPAEAGWADAGWDDRQTSWDALVDDTDSGPAGSDAPSAFVAAGAEPAWDPMPSWGGEADPGPSAFTAAPAPQAATASAFYDAEPAPAAPVATGEPAAPTPFDAAPTEDGTDEVLRQMARLSPKAAEAIAAALGTVADDPAEAAVVDDGFLRPG